MNTMEEMKERTVVNAPGESSNYEFATKRSVTEDDRVMVKEKVDFSAKPDPVSRDRSKVTNTGERIIYVFCPEMEEGFYFVVESPENIMDDSIGAIAPGVFWSSEDSLEKNEEVLWNEEINGHRNNNLPVDNNTSFVVNRVMLNKLTKGGGTVPCVISTIMVSLDNFQSLVLQLGQNIERNHLGHKILKLRGHLLDRTVVNEATFIEKEDVSLDDLLADYDKLNPGNVEDFLKKYSSNKNYDLYNDISENYSDAGNYKK